MNRIRALAPVFAFVWPAAILAQTRPVVTAADFGKWESLAAAALSPDGRWLAYGVSRVNEQNELRIRGTARDTTLVEADASGAVFTGDSRWLAFTINVPAAEREKLTAERKPIRNDVGLINLTTLERWVMDDIAQFRFSGDGRYLALRGYPPEGKRVADLVVRDLARGTHISFGNVTEFAWSQPGAQLAFTVQTESGTGNAVQVYDAQTGAVRVLDSSESLYRAIAWREKASDLAVLRTAKDAAFRDTTHTVLAWTRVGSTAQAALRLDPAGASGVPAGMRVSESFTPQWSEDGSVLFIGLRPRTPAKDSATTSAVAQNATADSARNGQDTTQSKPPADKPSDVQVWHARDVRIIPMQKSQEQQDLQRTLLAAWHPSQGRVVRIGTDLQETTRVLRGSRHATETDRSGYAFGVMFGRPAQDVYLIDVATGERRKVLENVRHFYGGSATGARLLWYDDGAFWSYDVASRRRTNLTANVRADFSNTEWDYPVDKLPPRGVAGWTKNDGAVLVYDQYDVWSLAPDGSGGRRLTDGAAEQVVHRIISLGDTRDGLDTSRPVYLSVTGERSKKSGFARITAGRTPERLVFEDARVFRLLRADSAAAFAFTRERFDDSPDWFLGGPELRSARQVSATNPFQGDYAWGRSELVDFRSKSGRELQAVLLYPPNYDASKKYPMIVYTYELLSQQLHNYVVPSERSYYNFNVFTTNGYFVLLPDIVYRGGEPGTSALEAVEPAVQTIVDRALVDPARIGLVGHSWGGYQATYLPTRTAIFAASVAGAPITNFLSFAGAIHWTPGIAEFDHWETGQARMGVPPWEDFDAYLRNSPIHKVQDLETPLLMMFGDADGTVDWHQGIEFYNFARRAGKENFVMLVYPGEDHGLRKKENQIDYHRRILQWFGHWLKGEPPAEWVVRGVTWLDRKTILDSNR